MENTTTAVLVILGLLIGVGGVYLLDNPAPVVEYRNVSVPYEVEVEVITEVEVEVDSTKLLMDDALVLFFEELDDEDDLKCGGDRFDVEEIEAKRVYEDYSISYDDEDTTIEFTTKLKYDNGYDRCYKTFDVEVFYEEDEKPEVSYIVH